MQMYFSKIQTFSAYYKGTDIKNIGIYFFKSQSDVYMKGIALFCKQDDSEHQLKAAFQIQYVFIYLNISCITFIMSFYFATEPYRWNWLRCLFSY